MSKDKELHQRHMSRRRNDDSLVRKEHMPEKWERAVEQREKVLEKSQLLLGHPHSQTFQKWALCCV